MKPLFTLALLFVTVLCLAQRQNVYFLKNDGRYVKQRDSADYIRVVREPDSASNLYNVFEFYPNGASKLEGKSSAINPPAYEGACAKFYPNGKRQSVLTYKAGKLVGNAYEFYPNGKLYVVKKFPDVANADDDMQDSYQITAENDSLGTVLIADGNGYFKAYNDKFTAVVEEGNVKNGKRDGNWKGSDPGQGITYSETYEDGKFLSGTSIGKNGDSIKYNVRDVEPQFKGGVKDFYRYLGRNIAYPDYEREHNIQGKVILTFIVEKNGELSNIKVLSSVSDNIDKEAIRVVSESPKWIPGTEYGRNCRVYYTIPIDFSLSN